MLFSIALLLSKEALLYVGTSVRNGVVHYANARKRSHFGITFLILAVELFFIFKVHDPFAHVTLTGGVTAWESLVISIAEEA